MRPFCTGARRLSIGIAAWFVLGPLILAQAPPDSSPEMTQRDNAPTFQSKVNLVLVPVVVRDSQGRAIGNLTKENFQLYDKGKPQAISAFSVVKRGREIQPAPAAGEQVKPNEDKTGDRASPQRYAAYLFDDLHIEFGDLVNVQKAATAHIKGGLQPDERAAVFTTSGRTTLDFTGDRAQLEAAVMNIKPQPMYRQSAGQCPDISYYMSDLIVDKNDSQALQAATYETLACMHLDPKQMQTAQQMAQSTARQVLSVGEQETRVTLSAIKDVIRRIEAMPGQRVIILASPGFLAQTSEALSTKAGLLDRAARANVTISALDARGLFTGLMDASQQGPSSPQAQQLITQYFHDSAMVDEDVLAEMADGTGGTFFHNSNDLHAGFERIAAAPEFSYVLGFSPSTMKPDGSFHKLKVTLNERGYNIQARRGYYAMKHTGHTDDDAKAEIEEAVFSRDEQHGIPVDLHTQFFKPDPADAKLTVLARMDIRRLRFKKAGGRNLDDLTVVTVVFDDNGNYVTGLTKTVEMRLRDETLGRLGAGITVKSNFDIKPGTYLVRLVVRDAEGSAMAAQSAAVDIP